MLKKWSWAKMREENVRIKRAYSLSHSHSKLIRVFNRYSVSFDALMVLIRAGSEIEFGGSLWLCMSACESNQEGRWRQALPVFWLIRFFVRSGNCCWFKFSGIVWCKITCMRHRTSRSFPRWSRQDKIIYHTQTMEGSFTIEFYGETIQWDPLDKI